MICAHSHPDSESSTGSGGLSACALSPEVVLRAEEASVAREAPALVGERARALGAPEATLVPVAADAGAALLQRGGGAIPVADADALLAASLLYDACAQLRLSRVAERCAGGGARGCGGRGLLAARDTRRRATVAGGGARGRARAARWRTHAEHVRLVADRVPAPGARAERVAHVVLQAVPLCQSFKQELRSDRTGVADWPARMSYWNESGFSCSCEQMGLKMTRIMEVSGEEEARSTSSTADAESAT